MGLFDRAEASDDLDMDALLAGLQSFHRLAARSAQRIALETADAWSPDDLVHVWVNAQGVVVQTEIDEALFAKSTPAEVAEAMVAAAQTAAAKVRERVAALQASLWQRASELGWPDPRLLDGVEELDQLRPAVPLSAPDSPERRTAGRPLAVDEHARRWRLTVSAS